MKITPRSELDATRLAQRKAMPPGWRDGKIIEACEKPSKKGNEMTELVILLNDSDGNERTLRDWLTDAALGALKLRHCCEAVGCSAKYEAGQISQADFAGKTVRVRLTIKKVRGKPDMNEIIDYGPMSDAAILRSA